MRRLVLLFFVLAVLVIIPFLIWGDFFERQMSLENMVAELERSGGRWAWAIGIGLLLIDLLLPILGTVVMSALGVVYGWFWGGIFSTIGAMGAGLLAYGLCRNFGRRAGRWIAGEDGMKSGEKLFSGNLGGWVVALSRWLPVMPEVVACLAGLVRMPFRKFVIALACGCVPLGFAFAWIGEAGREKPELALILSATIPPVLWGIVKSLDFFRKS
ncbi:MAG: VTT domain-containing protein [Verrucomicrobiales bacterium]|nr:VTT domain-containing protein [Verrucomicrobiales bacterium]